MLIAILYCIKNINANLSTPTGYPFIEHPLRCPRDRCICSNHYNVHVVYSCHTGFFLAPRWAFSRDNALPNAKLIAYVHPRMNVPIVSISVTTLVSCLLRLINIGSSTVFNAMVSLTVSGFFGSYILPFSFLMYVRLRTPG